MIMDNPGPAFFEADPYAECALVFTLLEPFAKSGKRELMRMRCFEEDRMLATTVFLGERQHLWSGWRTIAEREGGRHLSSLITQLALADSRERFGSGRYMMDRCEGALIHSVGKGGIRLELTLSTRMLPIIEHHFADGLVRSTFLENQMFADGGDDALALATLGLLRGTDALAARLDAMAINCTAARRRPPH